MAQNLLNADHLAYMGKSTLEPQRTNNFTVIFTLPASVNGDPVLLQQAMDAFPIPKESNNPIVIKYGNEERKVAGVAEWDSIEFKIKDFIDKPIITLIMSWFDKVYDARTGIIGYTHQYKTQGTVFAFGPDGQHSRTFLLKGLWPVKVNPGEGSMADNTNNIVTVTMRADKCVEQI